MQAAANARVGEHQYGEDIVEVVDVNLEELSENQSFQRIRARSDALRSRIQKHEETRSLNLARVRSRAATLSRRRSKSASLVRRRSGQAGVPATLRGASALSFASSLAGRNKAENNEDRGSSTVLLARSSGSSRAGGVEKENDDDEGGDEDYRDDEEEDEEVRETDDEELSDDDADFDSGNDDDDDDLFDLTETEQIAVLKGKMKDKEEELRLAAEIGQMLLKQEELHREHAIELREECKQLTSDLHEAHIEMVSVQRDLAKERKKAQVRWASISMLRHRNRWHEVLLTRLILPSLQSQTENA